MIIVVTAEDSSKQEMVLVELLFQAGLDLLHVRKYQSEEIHMKAYLEGISEKCREKVVLHSHYHLADQYGINRLHFSESKRRARQHLPYVANYILSTSAHSMHDFNALPAHWSYAFVSPVFASISKKGYGDGSLLGQLDLRTNTQVGLVGLGGIDESNFHLVRRAGADGGALLGSIWQRTSPLKTFQQCKKIDRLY